MHKITVLVGSLRKDSINRKYAAALGKLGADLFDFGYPDLDLPIYNEDLWADLPAGVAALKESLDTADGVLFVTPEYNRAYTPAIKNAVDWGSRPYGKSSWPGKPVAVTGASGGAIGTAVAQVALRGSLIHAGTLLMGRPEMFYHYSADAIDAEGNFTNDKTRGLMREYLEAFSAWIAKHG